MASIENTSKNSKGERLVASSLIVAGLGGLAYVGARIAASTVGGFIEGFSQHGLDSSSITVSPTTQRLLRSPQDY